MPLVPNFLERTLFLTLNQAPAPLLDIWSAIGFRVALAGVRLGIFDTLEEKPHTAAELAQRLQTHPEATSVLLECLVSLGYLRRQDDTHYANTPMTQKWVVRSAEASFSPYFEYWGTMLSSLYDELESTLQNGTPRTNLYTWIEDQPQTAAAFQQSMIALAKLGAADLVKQIALPSGAHLLDVGGGHATYSMELCRQHPDLSVTVFDSPQALVTGRANVQQAGLTARIRFQEGDMLTDELGTGYDAVLLLNVVHGFSPEANLALFHRVAAALKNGGQIIIGEQFPDSAPSKTGKAVVNLLDMSYLHLLGGRVYTYPQLISWLAAAGFGGTRRKNLLKLGSSLVFASKQA